MTAARGVVSALVLGFGLGVAARPAPGHAQVPLGTRSAAGLTVTPAFEGWYENPDGSYSLSFGYFNRNFEEVLEIPLGPDNFIAPVEHDGFRLDGLQPTRFHPRRHWGVFVVKVPASFGTGRVVWTLRNRGKTFAIPGTLHPDWEIDALAGEAGAGNTPPVLRLQDEGPEGRGPAGILAGPLEASVGVPLSVTVWAGDDGRSSGSVVGTRTDVPVTLRWFKHQGVGAVTFDPEEVEVPAAGGEATTTVTFGAPGDYILRVRANDSSVSQAGHAQCCWTNGFFRVTVSP